MNRKTGLIVGGVSIVVISSLALAQPTPGMEVETSWIMEMLKGLGIGGGPVFATLYFFERRTSEALRKEGREQLIQIMTLTATVTTALAEITRAVTTVGQTSKDGMDALKQFISMSMDRKP